MFEALVTACLLEAPETCGPLLVPGYEAESKSVCEAALTANPPAQTLARGVHVLGTAHCAPTADPLDFEEVAEGVFVHTGQIALSDRENQGDVANIGFILGQTAVAVIDSGASRRIGEGVWRAIRTRTDLPVTHVILSHMHPDHVLGATPFVEAGAIVVGHRSLGRSLAERSERYLRNFAEEIGPEAFLGTGIVAIDLPVAESHEVDLGARSLTLQAWPQAHTNNDLTVFDPTTGVLFAGDLVFARHTPSLDGSLRGWQAVLEAMADMPVSGVVPGHGGPILGWPAGVAPLRQYLEILAAQTRRAIDDGVRIGVATQTVAASEASSWELFEIFNPQNASAAYTELEWE